MSEHDKAALNLPSDLCTVIEALAWIAFRGSLPPVQMPDAQNHCGLNGMPLVALRARITGEPWPPAGMLNAPSRDDVFAYIDEQKRRYGIDNDRDLLDATEQVGREWAAYNDKRDGIFEECETHLPALNAAVRAGKVNAFGSPEREHAGDSGQERTQIATGTLDEYRSINVDGRLGMWDAGDRLRFRIIDGYPGPFYSGIVFSLAELRKVWPASAAATAATISNERRLDAWLIDRMKAARDSPPGKAVIKSEAKQAGFRFSERAFAHCWATALKTAAAPLWAAPGRKSLRCIDTQI